MRKGLWVLVAVLVGLAAAPARAWFDEDDGQGWPLFTFHRYGGDVNRPAATPDRPYFHGDDAVPLGLRWRDLDAARAEAAEADAVAAAAAAAALSAPSRRHVPRRHRAKPRRPAPICVPAPLSRRG